MKKILLIGIIALVLTSCGKDNNENIICGVKDPIEDLEWLNKIVSIAMNDTTGNYIGSIYLENYNNNQVFYIDMSLGSGGLSGHWFNCNGSSLTIDNDNLPVATKDNVLFTNINYQ
jgi:PBP1b-binding outer membrane lipoprotein LpoB